MRETKEYVVVAFPTTLDAISAEKSCRQAGLSGRLIPTPREITASCGMAWRGEVAEEEKTEKVLQEASVETDGFYHINLFGE